MTRRISQSSQEIAYTGDAAVRSTGAFLDVVHFPVTSVRTTYLQADVAYDAEKTSRITLTYTEVLHDNNDVVLPPPPAPRPRRTSRGMVTFA